MFITIEGIEASGKSTLIDGLFCKLTETGNHVIKTHEPGGTIIGDAIRALFITSEGLSPRTETLLLNASRAALVEQVIRPELESGGIVLCDRYIDSTLAYQGYGRGYDPGYIQDICYAAIGDHYHGSGPEGEKALVPDLTLLLDIPVDVSMERSRERAGQDRIERESREFHQRVRDGFLRISQSPDYRDRIFVIDGLRTPNEILNDSFAMILRLITQRDLEESNDSLGDL